MGPIASLPDVEKEINAKQETNIYYGLNRMLLGLLKKLVLAESLVIYVSSALDFKDSYPAFDFSGYCDIAIGASAMWGVRLPENFNFPFRQKTWAAFWRSWHSSLTQLLWQYIFTPLYLFCNRKNLNKLLAKTICTIAVFSFMAFFNGIKSGFFISALLYALFYLIELIFERKTGTISNLLIFSLFSVGLLFFRNPNYTDYSFLTERLLDFNSFLPTDWLRQYFAPLASGGALSDYFNFSFTLMLCFAFLFFERRIFSILSQNKINYAVWFLLLVLLATWGVFTSGSRFIYMQF
jgi:alginate O-acetyltransferase complex protein AlgI